MKTVLLVKSALITGSLFTLGLAGSQNAKSLNPANHQIMREPYNVAVNDVNAENTMQVALLLDTSNSMDGLIEQAKSRLWNIVNTLSTLKYDGRTPKIEIALYEYGNDGLQDKNWVRKVTPLTQDLDLISEKLFSLRTNGGTEYCGAAIKDAVSKLEWNGNTKAMKLIYIAGNEPFNQEGVNYREAISDAKKKRIFVNTIFCGDRKQGIETYWQDGAVLGGGKYFNIDSDRKVIFIETPYDIRISALNLKLNDTYIGYGSQGQQKKAGQLLQDVNAASLSKANAVERTVSKSRKEAYRAESWDLVDKAESDRNFVQTIRTEDLPAELKGKSTTEISKIVNEKSRQRSQVQKEISELAIKRQTFIDEELKKRASSSADDLGKALETSIRELGRTNGYTF